ERIKNINGTLTYYAGPPLMSQGVNPEITKSCRNLQLEDGQFLVATCLVEVSTEIDLDGDLGNDDGKFNWGWVWSNWSKSSKGVAVVTENAVLRAELYIKDKKTTVSASVNLSERIKNVNGALTIIEYNE
ncbi:hypothetical protein DFQ26_005864, partial [Actinomortierella ambigua]